MGTSLDTRGKGSEPKDVIKNVNLPKPFHVSKTFVFPSVKEGN